MGKQQKYNPEWYQQMYKKRRDEILPLRLANERARVARCRAQINALKAAPCMDCGGTFPPECMDFDHRDPSTKKFNISYGARWNFAKVEAEIAKCDLVCANCHRIRTWGKKTAPVVEAA